MSNALPTTTQTSLAVEDRIELLYEEAGGDRWQPAVIVQH